MNATMFSRVAFRGVCLPVLALFLSVLTISAQEAQPRKVNSGRLKLSNELFYVVTKGQLEAQPFTGIAFTEGTGWRAEVTYQDGILDGPVTVVVNQKVFSQFRYDKGLKVLEK